ncbi:peptidyl-prolyl cis-trans isomerase FKBP8 isoform X3 [Eurytemora carolleeae]|uniref:peptidyl-prolyl cis-trans isomerase FKBP8 isoform X3 n=1 Tax=Eurytemora carolleeae TaxID=1294199 RepID=UPI000C76694F|nr:peptidyl-prolyl cis-trans isomerase FKBP8 isoform X3 [Eurytemora carolleeae]|eukprot:XP_023345477.1 peptidyl-prolyl cis-trans isomerase FKBP8-like isoform X3 [Eurytemora affinis]
MNLLCLKSYFAEKMSGVSNIDMMEGETEFPEDILDDDDYSEMPELTESPKKTGVSEAKDTPNEAKEEIHETSGIVGEWEDILGSGRLRKKILIEGTGDKPDKSIRVRIHLKEFLYEDGDCIKDEELEMNVGEFELVQALDLILPLMRVGETCRIESESAFCYGEQGDGDRVPGNHKLYLEVELISARDLGPIRDLPDPDRPVIGNEKRLRGNYWFNRGDYSQAIQCYRKAAEFLYDENLDDQELEAQMKLKAWDSALVTVNQVLRIEVRNEKAIFRKGKIHKALGNVKESLAMMEKVLRIYPHNRLAQVEVKELTKKLKETTLKEQRMARKMLGLPEDPPPPPPQPLITKNEQIIRATLGAIVALTIAILVREISKLF